MKIGLLNHGCAKNLVDSELMLGSLADAGYEITLDDTQADVVIVNTCSFIHDAEKESVESILEVANSGKKVVITGCLPQKHKQELAEAIPEAVAFVGIGDFPKIVDVIKRIEKNEKNIYEVSETPVYHYPENTKRQQITAGSSSYLKIAEGCNFKCGYCIIPKLRGDYVSRPLNTIVEEAKEMAKKGVSEIILIAQDTTSWGKDIFGKPSLPILLKELDKIDEIDWIRIMYTYPSLVDDELLEVMANSKKIVNYIDIPLQHSHPDVLKRMNRPSFDYRALIEKIRSYMPECAIRTTFITGYPQETDEEFEHLYNFVKDMRFDKMGAFEFCSEKGTYAHTLKGKIKSSIKKQRRKKLMELQQKISYEINQSYIGKTIPVIVEAVVVETNQVIGRSFRDAPEVDGMVYIETEQDLNPTDIVDVLITDADEYDLFGKV